ncbi:hypothetical protein LOK49_LG02G01896 [Camellia lanceoleosa]|uniref:Uncharacterized protein n=1 Tax=Camellia lanceoleosa TaxID=1840588 RepID=A0ACC0IRQ3_9ERIC|nr:hypothetical protein LOK49_LG02G01896 [Camellia lanceoleosa]
MTKRLMISTKPEKMMNRPNLTMQRAERKIWATRKVNDMFMATTILCADDRILRGKILLGTNHPRGPHENANAVTNMQMQHTRMLKYSISKFVASPVTPNLAPTRIDTALYIYK